LAAQFLYGTVFFNQELKQPEGPCRISFTRRRPKDYLLMLLEIWAGMKRREMLIRRLIPPIKIKMSRQNRIGKRRMRLSDK
jgi:hypothetical protein